MGFLGIFSKSGSISVPRSKWRLFLTNSLVTFRIIFAFLSTYYQLLPAF